MLIDLSPPGADVIDRIGAAQLQELATLVPDCTDDELRTAVAVMAALSRDVRRKALEVRTAGDH